MHIKAPRAPRKSPEGKSPEGKSPEGKSPEVRAVLARRAVALVEVIIAVDAGPAPRADTGVRIQAVLRADTTVCTRVAGALVHVRVTAIATPPRLAEAEVVVDTRLGTTPAVEARAARAFIDILAAPPALLDQAQVRVRLHGRRADATGKASRARTREGIRIRGAAIGFCTLRTVIARVAATLVDVDGAVLSDEAY